MSFLEFEPTNFVTPAFLLLSNFSCKKGTDQAAVSALAMPYVWFRPDSLKIFPLVPSPIGKQLSSHHFAFNVTPFFI